MSTRSSLDNQLMPTRTAPGPSEYFYFVMSVLILAPVAYGFSFTVGKNLLHPAVPRPKILYLHAAVFCGWLAFFISQSALVRMRRVRWHRRMGLFGIALGAAVLTLGVTTAIVMARFNTVALHATDAEASLVIPLFDMLCFGIAFTLGISWRANAEYHRRLMLIATCVLTAAGFGRFPEHLLPAKLFYAGVDLLILVGVARDVIVARRIHIVYTIALPALIVGQAITTYIAFHSVPFWLRLSRALLW